MKKNILYIGALVVMASCGRYSQVMEDAKKEDMRENSRVYGEVDGPARQSKNTYTAAPDAAEKSANMKDLMFGNGKSVESAKPQMDTAGSATDTAATPAKM